MKKVKNIGKYMIILGILLVLTGVGLIMQSKADKHKHRRRETIQKQNILSMLQRSK